MNEYACDNRPKIKFYSIECSANGEYKKSENPLENEARKREGNNLLNKSDYVFETIKLVLFRKIPNSNKLNKLLERIDDLENRIIDFEISSLKDDFQRELLEIKNESESLCNDICGVLNELR